MPENIQPLTILDSSNVLYRKLRYVPKLTDRINPVINNIVLHKLILLSICLAIGSTVKAQNLVLNSSFERFVDFNRNDSANWHKVQKSDTPDYFNFNPQNPVNNIYNKYMGNIAPKSGHGFVGVFCYRVSSVRGIRNIREFIESPLSAPMHKDSLYKIQLSLRLDIESNLAIKNFGVYFSTGLCSKNKKFNPFVLPPHIEFDSILLDSTHDWITLQAMYKARGNENNIVLGNFKSDRKTFKRNVFYKKKRGKRYKWDLLENEKAAYYYIDDVIVEKVEQHQETIAEVGENNDSLTIGPLLNVDEIEVDSVIILENIVFEFNKSDLLPSSFVELNRLKSFMVNNPVVRIKLEGHTDNIGDYDFNLKLSINRVEAVVAYLIDEGIAASRMEYAGYSFSRPLVSNDTEEGRKVNRRVTFKIIGK